MIEFVFLYLAFGAVMATMRTDYDGIPSVYIIPVGIAMAVFWPIFILCSKVTVNIK